MTKVAFISWASANPGRPYSKKTYEIRTYIVRDDTKFEKLTEYADGLSLEELALMFKVIELEDTISAISNVWKEGESAIG